MIGKDGFPAVVVRLESRICDSWLPGGSHTIPRDLPKFSRVLRISSICRTRALVRLPNWPWQSFQFQVFSVQFQEGSRWGKG